MISQQIITESLDNAITHVLENVERRAFLKEHSDVGTFVDQHIAAGAYSQRLAQIYENYFGHDKWVEGYLYIYSRLVIICVTKQ